MAIALASEQGRDWQAIHGDAVEVLRQMPDRSVGFSIYSPPFANLFTYSDSDRDVGNCRDDGEFAAHYQFIVDEIARLTKPGRLTAVHCSDLPTTKWKDGVIGVRDFSGQIREIHEQAGFHLVRRITVWRDPVVEMTRTKALNLLYKQVQKDTCKCWPGLADYVMLFRAPGENVEPVGHQPDEFPLEQWQRWASPVWMDISQTDTLNAAAARSGDDERHICPLQLGLIRRAVIMWSNPSDVVLSPFMGIGSEGYIAIQEKRKFVGIELKEEYFIQALRNLKDAARNAGTLFALRDTA